MTSAYRTVRTLGSLWREFLGDQSVENLSVIHEVSGELLRDRLGDQLGRAHIESIRARAYATEGRNGHPAMIPNTPPIPSELP